MTKHDSWLRMPKPTGVKGALAEGSRQMPPLPGRFRVGSLPESSSWDFVCVCVVVLGVRCWTQAFSCFGEWELLSTCRAWLPLLGSTGSRHTGLAASWLVESCGSRDRNCVPALAGTFLSTAPPTREGLRLGLVSASSLVTYLKARFPFWHLHHQERPLFLFPKYLLNSCGWKPPDAVYSKSRWLILVKEAQNFSFI